MPNSDAITLGQLRRDLQKKTDEMLLLLDPEDDFAVCVAKGEGLKLLANTVKRQTETRGPADALKEVNRLTDQKGLSKEELLAGNGMNATLTDIRRHLPEGATHIITRGSDDEEGAFISFNARGEQAEMLFGALCLLGLIDPPDEPATAKA